MPRKYLRRDNPLPRNPLARTQADIARLLATRQDRYEDDPHSLTGESSGTREGVAGQLALEKHRRDFYKHPILRYRTGMEVVEQDHAQQHDWKSVLDYFHVHVPLGEVDAPTRERLHWFTLFQKLHKFLEHMLSEDQISEQAAAPLLGLVMTAYIFADQATLSPGTNLDTAWGLTLLEKVTTDGFRAPHARETWERGASLTPLIGTRQSNATMKARGEEDVQNTRHIAIEKSETDRLNATRGRANAKAKAAPK